LWKNQVAGDGAVVCFVYHSTRGMSHRWTHGVSADACSKRGMSRRPRPCLPKLCLFGFEELKFNSHHTNVPSNA
jgi:hypothetical protein